MFRTHRFPWAVAAIWCSAAGFSLWTVASWAQTPARTHDIGLEDYFTIGVMTDCAVSPDGKWAAYTELRWEPPAETRNQDIWVVSTAGGDPLRLTFESGGDGSPIFSPDGQWIYFAAGRKGGDAPPRDGKTQVWRIRVDGTQETPITREKEGIEAFELSRDGRSLYFQTSSKSVKDPWKDMKAKYDSLKYGHGVTQISKIQKLDLVNWRTEVVVDEKRFIKEFSVAPDESRIAMVTTPDDVLINYEGWSRVDLFDAKTRSMSTLEDRLWREDAPSPHGWISTLAWSSDNKRVAFRVDWDGYPSEIYVAQYGQTGEPRIWKMERPMEVTVDATHMEWMPGRADLCFTAQDHARAAVYCVQGLADGKQGVPLKLTPGDVCISDFALPRSADRAVIVMSEPTHPPDLFMVWGSGKETKYDRLARINPQVDAWKLPQIQIVSWTSPDGTPVEGILELPPDYKPGSKPLPMVVELHGGPTAAALFELQYWIYGRTLYAAKGFALFSPNYRGSTGYGDKFMIDLIAHENDREVADILSGVDAMVERGMADPDRLGVMGWSNGGYLTNCLITHTDRFKAASSGAGILDMTMQWLAEDTPGHVVNFQQGFPWTVPDRMQAVSALYQLDKVKTPTLIHVGEGDERCPPAHSSGLHRALNQYLHVPCELVIYPGEPHGLTQYTHRKAKMEWDWAWMTKYVLGQGEEKPAENSVSMVSP